MKIWMVATESNPFVKIGGLGDVVFGLSKALQKQKNNLRIILPFYKSVAEKEHEHVQFVTKLDIKMAWRTLQATIYRKTVNEVEFYFVANHYYFDRDGIYGFSDDDERWAFFVLALRELIIFEPNKPNIIHVHDYHPAMLSTVVKEYDGDKPWASRIKFGLTIHSPAYRGEIDRSKLDDYYNLHTDLYDFGHVRFNNQVSTLKAAIVDADFITTVSPTHAVELLSESSGFGLHVVLGMFKDKFTGILNGIDIEEWNPFSDHYLDYVFDEHNWQVSKQKNKKSLIEQFGLTNPEAPLFVMITRLTFQKGVKLVIDNIHHFVSQGCQFIILGAGEWELEQSLKHMENIYPSSVKVVLGYNNGLAHKMYASGDFFLMPSLFEPCGIAQMISLRYGTLPIVRETGGLVDTVISPHQNHHQSTGFSFVHYTGDSLGWSMHEAIQTFYNKEAFSSMKNRAFACDFSWNQSSLQYLKIYKKL
jgi:starch synthase